VSTVDTLPTDQPASGPEHGPAWGEGRCRLSGAVLQVANTPEPKWDSNGYRIGPNCHRRFRAVTGRDAHVARTGRAQIPGVLLS
jgi:hypothetical protein